MDREWKLGVDLSACDNLLDGITFDDLILAVHCNCRDINRMAVHQQLSEILAQRRQDMVHLLEQNIETIMAEARKGRER